MDMLDNDISQLQGPKRGLEFRDILNAGWRRKWFIVIPLVTCIIGGLLICALWTKSYTCEAVLHFPRHPLAGELGSAEAFRYHQTKFRERVEAVRLQVINKNTLEPSLRRKPNLFDPDKKPSLSYRLKVLFFRLEKEKFPGVAEQIDDIISNIRLEVDERQPIVKISYTGTTRTNAKDMCQLIVDLIKEVDATRRDTLSKEVSDRQNPKKGLEAELSRIDNILYRLKDKVITLPENIPFLRELMRARQYDMRQVNTQTVDLRTRLSVAMADWKTTPKYLANVIIEGEKQEEPEEEKLASDELAEVEEYLMQVEGTLPEGHPTLEMVYAERKRLLVDVQIENERKFQMSYMLPKLEKEYDNLSSESAVQEEEISALFTDRNALIEEEGKGPDSEEVKSLDDSIRQKKREYALLSEKVEETASELNEYRKLQSLIQAKKPEVVGEEEGVAAGGEVDIEGEDIEDDMASVDIVNIKNLQEQLNDAITVQTSQNINPLWITSLAEVISLHRSVDHNTSEIMRMRKELQDFRDNINNAQGNAQKIKNSEVKREELVKKLEEKTKYYNAAKEVLDAFDREYGERMQDLVRPQLPLFFSSPKFRVVLIIAMLAGLTIGAMLVLIAEYTDHTLKKPGDLKNVVRQPILAAIPSLQIPAGVRGAPQSLFYRTKREVEEDINRGILFDKEYLRDIRFRNIATEQMRKLRIAMLEGPFGGNNRPRTILVTSALAGEGKSTVSANFAVAISQMIGEYVLLVDSDLRRPDLHNFFGMPPRPGLAEYLSEDINLADLLIKTDFEKLTLLQAGRVPANSTELLHSEKMNNLIKELKSRYSDRYIIIDSPPIMSTSEPDVLAEQVDGVVVVVRAGMTPREIVEDVVSQINPDKLLGVIMNDVKSGISKYYAPTYSL